MVLHRQAVGEDAKHLRRQHRLVHAVVMIQRRLRTPAQRHRRIAVVLRPIKIGLNFFPVVDLLKGNRLYRRACHQKGIIIIILDIAKFQISSVEIRIIRVRRFAAHYATKVNLNLQRRITQKTQQLNFCRLLERHKIQNTHLQRTNTLRRRTLLRHRKNSFLL